MSDKHKHIAFLCGHFKRTEDVKPENLLKLGWTLVRYGDEERQNEKRYYYPDFVDFCYNTKMDVGCVRYTRQVDTEATIVVGKEGEQRQLSFTVREITLYFMPQQMVLYSIRVDQEVSTFDDCSALMYKLRYIDDFDKETFAVFRNVAVQPIVEVYNSLKKSRLQDYTQLVENGNKLRLFQIVHAADGSLTSDEARRLIEVTRQSFFEGIKFAKVGYRISDIGAAIQEYVESHGYSVVRDYVGHGVGKKLHEAPEVPNFKAERRFLARTGNPRLVKGMTIAVEPMVNAGGWEIKELDNGWTVVTADGSLSAHYENTILITDGEPEILTMADDI